MLFSGVAVAIGLSGLLWFRASALSSIGLGGAIVVLASVFYSLTFLPAILGMLGHRVNSLSVGGILRRLGLRRNQTDVVRRSRWERVAIGVMRRPFVVLIPVLALLLIVGSPYLRLTQGVPDATVYPAGVASRDAWVALQTEFRAGETTPIVILLDTKADPTSAESIAAVTAVAGRVAAVDGIDRVEGPFSIMDPATGQPMTAGAGRPALRGAVRLGPAGDCRGRCPTARRIHPRQRRPARRDQPTEIVRAGGHRGDHANP